MLPHQRKNISTNGFCLQVCININTVYKKVQFLQLHGKPDLLLIIVDLDYLDLDCIAYRYHIHRVIYILPAHLRNVKHWN